MLWKNLLIRYGAQFQEGLDISSLAKVSDGYTPGHLTTVVSQVLTERRIQQLRRRPITTAEFIPFLSKIDPIYKEEEESYKVQPRASHKRSPQTYNFVFFILFSA